MRTAYVVASSTDVTAARRHAQLSPSGAHVVATTPAAAAALAAWTWPAPAPAPARQYLPPAYAHGWEEFPAASPGDPLRVWCSSDAEWERVRAHRPHATRWGGTGGQPTFPRSPLAVDAEAGRFTWRLAHGGQLRAWGALS